MTQTNGSTATVGRFAIFEAAEQEGEPIGFQLAGEQFTCVPIAPAGALAHLLRMAGTTVPLDESVSLIEEMLVDEELERFRATVYRKNPVVKGSVVGAVVNFLIDSYTGRPLAAPES